MEKQTFVESKGQKPFNWNKFLSKKKYTSAELRNASYLASHWVTCACGNLCDIIPRATSDLEGESMMEGEPMDRKLAKLGYDFNNDICGMSRHHDDFRFTTYKVKAIKTLRQIEKRSAELIKLEVKKLKTIG